MTKPSSFNVLHDSLKEQVAVIHRDTVNKLPSMGSMNGEVQGVDDNNTSSRAELDAENKVANRKLAALIDQSLEASFSARLKHVQVDLVGIEKVENNKDVPSPPNTTMNSNRSMKTGNPMERLEQRNLLANSLKRKGDNEFKAGNTVNAVELYTSSLDLNRQPNTYSNRAAALLKVGRVHESERDCYRVLTLCRRDASSDDTKLRIKAFFRRALARQQLGLYDDALNDLESVLLLESNNKRAQSLSITLRNQVLEEGKYPQSAAEWDARLVRESLTQVFTMANFMEDWLRGKPYRKEKRIYTSNFNKSFSPADGVSFTTASTGEMHGRSSFERQLYELHGSKRGYAPPFMVEIRNPIARAVCPGTGPLAVCVVVYEVALCVGGSKPVRRRATAIFRWKKSSSNNIGIVKEKFDSKNEEEEKEECKTLNLKVDFDRSLKEVGNPTKVELVHLQESIIKTNI